MLTGLVIGCQQAPAPEPSSTPAPAQKPETMTIKAIGYMDPTRQAQNTEYLLLIELINSRTGDEFQIEYVGGGEVIPSKEQPESLSQGAVDMLFHYGSSYSSQVPEITLLSLSKMGPAGTHLLEEEMKSGGVYDFVRKAHERYNMYFLGRADSQNVATLFTNKKVEKIADFAGQSFITGSPIRIKFVEGLGAEAVAIPPADAYNALERGLATGTLQTPSEAYKLGLQEFVKYIILPSFKENSNMLVVLNLDTWNKIPSHIKKIIQDTQVEVWHMSANADLGRQDNAIKMMQAYGLEICRIPNNELPFYMNLYNEGAKERLKEQVSAEVYNEILRLAEH